MEVQLHSRSDMLTCCSIVSLTGVRETSSMVRYHRGSFFAQTKGPIRPPKMVLACWLSVASANSGKTGRKVAHLDNAMVFTEVGVGVHVLLEIQVQKLKDEIQAVV